MFTPGVLVGRLFDLGHFRLPYFVGSMGIVTTTLLVAECKQYWQFLLVQGVLFGVGVPKLLAHPSFRFLILSNVRSWLGYVLDP